MSGEEQSPVKMNIDKETLLDILKRAASQERTVVEFQTREREDGERELHHALDITDHVEQLEDDLDAQV